VAATLRIHSLWEQLLTVGFGELEAAELSKAEAAGIASSRKLDDQVLREFHWHAASGKRLRLSKECFGSPQVRENLLWYYATLAPSFYLTHWLLKRGGEGPATWPVCLIGCTRFYIRFHSFFHIVEIAHSPPPARTAKHAANTKHMWGSRVFPR